MLSHSLNWDTICVNINQVIVDGISIYNCVIEIKLVKYVFINNIPTEKI